MAQNQSSIEDIKRVCSQLIVESMKESGKKYRNDAESWLTSKRRAHNGREYLSQLEKNAVYFNENLMGWSTAMAQYFHDGFSCPSREQWEMFVEYLKQPALEAAPAHLSFLVNGCSSCKHHSYHDRYSTLRSLRADSAIKYQDELEYSCKFNHLAHAILNEALFRLTFDPRYASFRGVAAHLNVGEAVNAIYSLSRNASAASLAS